MIKHFNTALSSSSSSGSSKSGKGIGTIVMIGALALIAYFGYKYLVERNQPVAKTNED
jgi:hypothetical protein